MVRPAPALFATLALGVLVACGSSRPVNDGGGSAYHAAGWVDPANHGPAAMADLASCQLCHGADYGGAYGPSCNQCHANAGYANWTQNCTFCHGTKVTTYTAADLPTAAPATGAHAKHMEVAVACGECHTVPTTLDHLDGVARINFGSLAKTGGLAPTYTAPSCSAVYCHGSGIVNGAGASTTPAWNGTVACGDCHAIPPHTASPDFPNNGHLFHVGIGQACATCHPGYSDTTVAAATHVNGLAEYTAIIGGGVKTDGWTCASCHP
jgi:predicted CxxxxCH...CXXCH cytochrome family protein